MVKRQFETITSGFKRVRLNTWLLLMLGTAVLVALIGWLGSWGFRVVQDWTHLQESPTDATQKQFNASLEIVKAIVGGLGTLATIVGGIVLYLNFRVANRNAELTESRLITERFSKAVEQLGSDKIEVRLGGIYALERIAQDSVRDHWTIMEVLTAFVRERSPVEPTHTPQVKESLAEHYLHQQSKPEIKSAPVTKDVQAALTVIGRREAENDPEGQRLDLSYCNLSDAVVYGANFSHANLKHVNLSSTKLIHANLSNANLSVTNLIAANLIAANLSSADLSYANFSYANLITANLSSADLSYANLYDADLRNANLYNTFFGGATLYRANLSDAVLYDAEGLPDEQLKSAMLCLTTLPNGTVSDRDCEALGLPPSTNSASEPEPDNP